MNELNPTENLRKKQTKKEEKNKKDGKKRTSWMLFKDLEVEMISSIFFLFFNEREKNIRKEKEKKENHKKV